MYAIGDCVATPGLAHVAYAEAVVAVDHILGETPVPVDYGKVPWVVYTHPEVAWSGLTEAQAKAAGHDVVVHKHSFAGNGRAMILGETDGPGQDRRGQGRPDPRLPPRRAVGQRAAARGLPGGQLGGAAQRRRPADPRAPEPVRGDRRNHDHLLRPLAARLSTDVRSLSPHPLADAHSRHGRHWMSNDEWVVTMPKLGETVTEGELTNWLKRSVTRSRSTIRCSRCPPTRWIPRSPARTTG